MPTDETREAVIAAAAELFAEQGIAVVGRRAVAAKAGVAKRTVTSVGSSRSELLADVVAGLPFPPTPQRIADQVARDDAPPMQVLLEAARDAIGTPEATWDQRELQALVLTPYDSAIRDVMTRRTSLRWNAVASIVARLRQAGGVDSGVGDDAAALHVMAVGAGLALLAPVMPDAVGSREWLGLAARLLESVAAADPAGPAEGTRTRTWRVRVTIPDTPAAVSRLMRTLALVHAAAPVMLSNDHERGTQVVDMALVVPAAIDRESLATGLAAVATDVVVLPGSPEDTDDIATRVLRAAADLAAHPAFAPVVVAGLVAAESWEVTAASAGEDTSARVMRLQWTPETHVVLRRSSAPFTATEQMRASALLRLVTALASARGDERATGWAEQARDGRPIVVRLARPEDAEPVRDMHARCSEESRYQRYFQPISDWREENLRRISGGHRGATLVVTSGDDVIALGNVFPDRPGDVARAEIALIVEDDAQGLGVGRILLGRLIELAERLRFEEIVAYVLAPNTRMLDMLERTGLTWERQVDPELGLGAVRMVARLPR